MELTVNENRITVHGLSDGKRLLPILPAMEGAKKWLKDGGFSFEATPINIELFRRAFPDAPMPDGKQPVSAHRDDPGRAKRPPPVSLPYQSRESDYAHQQRAGEKWGRLPTFAVFAEMGTGKTKIIIDKAGELWCAGLITGVLVMAPRGPHEQWVDEQIPIHLGPIVKWRAHAWDKKPIPAKLLDTDHLAWFTMNIDAVKTHKGETAALDFIRAHEGRVLCVIDESQSIGNASSARTKVMFALAPLVDYRCISSGTPMGKNLLNLWSQYKFLDEGIVGMRYATSFKAEYCIVDRESKTVVGAKNVERFYARTERFTFRVTKEEELDLPPKVYDTYAFDMSDQQKRHYNELKATFMTELDSGERMSVTQVATMILRLQQITCGILTDDDGNVTIMNDNPRVEALQAVIAQRTGKTIIWCRFQHDVEQIVGVLGERAVAYYGKSSSNARRDAKAQFLDARSGVDYFVATEAAAEGENLQGDCRTAIYYSNSFNAIKRWQSEDRIHRIGTVGTVTYIDLICNRAVDKRILANLRAKKSLSDLVLDDIRKVVEG